MMGTSSQTVNVLRITSGGRFVRADLWVVELDSGVIVQLDRGKGCGIN
jgi:hypothetical protein